MKKRFLLFGEKPFEAYAREKFAEIANNIENISDIETVMYKEHFYDLVKKTIVANALSKVDISFENQIVDLVGRQTARNTRYFAEYSVIITGDTYFLGLSPFASGYRPVDLFVEVRGNVLSFEIDTCSPGEELTPELTAEVKKEYDRIKKYIHNTLENVNLTIDHFNREMEKFVVPILADRMRKAERSLKIKETLNFK